MNIIYFVKLDNTKENKRVIVEEKKEKQNKKHKLISHDVFSRVIKKLGVLYPNLFSKGLVLPLKKGIYQEIMADKNFNDSGASLRKALIVYTGSVKYLKAVISLKERYDFNGKVVEKITPEDLEYSKRMLDRRFQVRKETIAFSKKSMVEKKVIGE